MSSHFSDKLLAKAKAAPKKVVFPESDDERILRAAHRVRDMGIAYPVLIGNYGTIAALAGETGVPVESFAVVDHTDGQRGRQYVEMFLQNNQDFSAAALKRMLRNPLWFAAMMVALGEADCLAAGVRHTTGEVIMAGQTLIGLKEGTSTVSSVGVLDIPGFDGPEGQLLAIADCAVNPAPDSCELADIAITTADTLRNLLGWEPRVAMLSFSTKGSAEHENVEKVIKAVQIANERRPDLLIDGEFQLDAAVVPAVAAKKVRGGSAVAGRANIIIFPDLGAGNIGVKLVQVFAGATAAGPLLQGFRKPVTDFSRSAPVEEIVGAITIVVACAQ